MSRKRCDFVTLFMLVAVVSFVLGHRLQPKGTPTVEAGSKARVRNGRSTDWDDRQHQAEMEGQDRSASGAPSSRGRDYGSEPEHVGLSKWNVMAAALLSLRPSANTASSWSVRRTPEVPKGASATSDALDTKTSPQMLFAEAGIYQTVGAARIIEDDTVERLLDTATTANREQMAMEAAESLVQPTFPAQINGRRVVGVRRGASAALPKEQPSISIENRNSAEIQNGKLTTDTAKENVAGDAAPRSEIEDRAKTDDEIDRELVERSREMRQEEERALREGSRLAALDSWRDLESSKAVTEMDEEKRTEKEPFKVPVVLVISVISICAFVFLYGVWWRYGRML